MNIGAHKQYPLAELNCFHKNARRGDIKAIMESIQTNGVYRPIYVNKGTHTGRPLEVLAGNHTLQAMRQLAEQHPHDPRWQTVDVWEVDVDEQRATKIVLADNRTAELGGYDDDTLMELLRELDDDLDGTGFTKTDLDNLLEITAEDDDDTTTRYTQEVNIPQYEPQSINPPELAACIDTRKTDQLCANIAAADVPDEVKNFLKQAAQRHTVLDFQKIAEYYAHADAETQKLMEQQALVIIDVNDAIREGYAELSAMIETEMNREDWGN